MVGVLRHTLACKWVTISHFVAIFQEQYNIHLDGENVLRIARANPRFETWARDGEEPQIRGRPRDQHHHDGDEA